MSLIKTDRHRPDDLQEWDRWERACEIYSQLDEYKNLVSEAKNYIDQFVNENKRFCVSVSWGKDSTATLSLCKEVINKQFPVVWIKPIPIYNPDCEKVRDRFLSRLDLNYFEVKVNCKKKNGSWMVGNAIQRGFERAAEEFGSAYIYGLRASESADRKRKSDLLGAVTKNTCAPLDQWESKHVFAYLLDNDLPIHPAYAMSKGGTYETDKLRVSSLGISNGNEQGKKQWEQYYYGDKLREIGHYDDSVLVGNMK